jgi:transposase
MPGPPSRSWTWHTGEIRDAQVFVGALGASSYTFVDLTWSRSLPDWTASHVRMLEAFQGVPELLVPDNEKSGVKAASHYEPDVNPSYHDLATHYGTTVLPTRPYAPRDKESAPHDSPQQAVGNSGSASPSPSRPPSRR